MHYRLGAFLVACSRGGEIRQRRYCDKYWTFDRD